MDFLVDSARPKILRTVLYDDQEFHRFELELLHTPLFQRLYDLKQLGYSDRVFPDAVHSRFNHLVGVAEIAERMTRRLLTWLDRHKTEKFAYSNKVNGEWIEIEIGAVDLVAHVNGLLPVVRLMGLLHDITHGAFGHTLEDEVSVFTEKHDAPERQIRFFDALIGQLVTLWGIELRVLGVDSLQFERLNALEIDAEKIRALAKHIGIALEVRDGAHKILVGYLKDLELACRLLLCLEGTHSKSEKPDDQTDRLLSGRTRPLLISEVIREIEPLAPPLDLIIHRDLFLIDLVGNTICADLIDYARRDAANAGVRASFDQRLIRYICVVSVSGVEFVPGGKRAIRTAIQIFTNKLRNDVLTEMSLLLKARYLISERITFHPTKCAAGACLGTAVQLVGLMNPPPWVQSLGDQSFLQFLMRCALAIDAFCDFAKARIVVGKDKPGEHSGDREINVDTICASLWPTDPRFREVVSQCLLNMGLPTGIMDKGALLESIKERAQASQRILWKLAARRYPKLAYRLHGAVKSGSATQASVARKYNEPTVRYELERRIEDMCHLPTGTVHIHCPIGTTSMKAAEALVVGSDLTRITHLRTVTNIYDDPVELVPYQQEIKAVEDMYSSIWNLHVYVDVAHMDKKSLVAMVADEELGFANDPLLKNESDEGLLADISVYDVLAERKNAFAFDQLPLIIAKLDDSASLSRFRGRGKRTGRVGKPTTDDLHKLVTDAAHAVADEMAEKRKGQTGRPKI